MSVVCITICLWREICFFPSSKVGKSQPQTPLKTTKQYCLVIRVREDLQSLTLVQGTPNFSVVTMRSSS